MPAADLFVILFVLIDEFLKQYPDLLRRPGPEPDVSDAEVMTLMAMQAMSGEIPDEAWLRRVRRDFGAEFPRLPGRSRYQRRRAILSRALLALVRGIQAGLGEDPRLRIADSAPVPVCRNARARRCKAFGGDASWGWCAAQEVWFFGFRLHLLVTERGLPAVWTILTAKAHDRRGLDILLAEEKELDVFGDAAYNVRPPDRERFAGRGVTITAAPKRNMKPLPRHRAGILKRVRFRVDWALGLLSRVFHVQRTLARATEQLFHRVSFCLAAFNLAVWVNVCLQRPLFLIKELAN